MPLTENEITNFYEKYAAMVWRRCHQILKDSEEARDAMHDVFVKLMDKKDKMEGTFPSSLLFTMATHICLNRIRDSKNRNRLLNDDLAHIALADEEQKNLTNIITDRIMGRESASTRVMAYLHYGDGMTLNEVAAETGLSVSGVRKRLRQFKERVQQSYKEPV